jgi:hypothetical protein
VLKRSRWNLGKRTLGKGDWEILQKTAKKLPAGNFCEKSVLFWFWALLRKAADRRLRLLRRGMKARWKRVNSENPTAGVSRSGQAKPPYYLFARPAGEGGLLVRVSSRNPAAWALLVHQRWTIIYSNDLGGYRNSTPFVIESTGRLGPSAQSFLKDITAHEFGSLQSTFLSTLRACITLYNSMMLRCGKRHLGVLENFEL